ncbi:MAG: hypothetical protein JXN64_01570 [Spirochaetes bacterium]|nr:hypothetical protein [Spirochaetota bacterium]
MKKISRSLLLTFAAAFMFTACGDSGGGGSSGHKGWQTAELIETDNTGDAKNPQIAMNPEGNAIAVWVQWNGSFYDLIARRYVKGTGWTAPEVIEDSDTANAESPQIGMDSEGSAIAVWRQDIVSHYNLYANIFIKSSGTWSGPELIENMNTGHASEPQIAVNPQGNAVAVWIQNESGVFNIYANIYTKGSGWAGAGLIDSGAGQASDPQTIIDTENNVIVVWAQTDGAADNIYANRYNGSVWEGVKPVEDSAGNAMNPQITSDADGNAIAVWSQDDGSKYSIYANRYVKNTNLWGTASLIETDNYGFANSPQIAIDQDGNAIAVWWQDIGNCRAYANRYDNTSGSWGSAELIDNNDSKVYSPQIAVDAAGNGIAVWAQVGGTEDNIWANKYVSGSGWGTAVLIETGTENAQNPQIAINADGNAIAVWEQDDGTRYNIWANYFYK